MRILENSVDLVTLFFSSLLIGNTIIPIDPRKGKTEREEILNQFSKKKIISSKNNSVHDSFIEIDKLKDQFHKSSIKDLEIFDHVDFEKNFLITFTSGTSGTQKGVIHSFRNLIQSALSFNQKFDFGKSNRFLHNFSMTYMAGILNLIVLPLVSKSQIILAEQTTGVNIANFWNTVKKFSANTFWLNPTMLELMLILDRSDEGKKYVKNEKITICVATAPLNASTKKRFEQKYDVKTFESYGLSETLFISTNFPYNDKLSSVGKILENVKLKFSENEILVNLPWKFLGYHNLVTEEFFDESYFLTGDLGSIDENGFLSLIGRKKEIIIKGGINISPRKIEDFIKELKILDEVVILGFPSKLLGEKIVCVGLISKNDLDFLKKSINRQILEKLGRDYCVDEFVSLDKIPKNLNGKIDKIKIQRILEEKINDS